MQLRSFFLEVTENNNASGGGTAKYRILPVSLPSLFVLLTGVKITSKSRCKYDQHHYLTLYGCFYPSSACLLTSVSARLCISLSL